MSTWSAKTAVTWEKPLREIERVYSSPGIPDSAVSIGKVTCVSISCGDIEATWVLTWTWLLVMSGTASIDNRGSAARPRPAASPVRRMMIQRCRIEKARIRSSNPDSVGMFGLGLSQLGLEQEAVRDGHRLTGGEPPGNL